ncbi:MAG: DUF4097 family beta strand repeat protein [Ktedonobacteraceae bacterium]|nr:DUF4097 family beta strand repeat protein [Ktedonobacteraceae bacterium]MBO0795691.1 DUF4097 family beta strand repeat protein [Ktedonobacteraceae bacterium]
MQSMQPQEGSYQPRERSTWQEEEQLAGQEIEQPYNESRWNIEERGEKLRPTQQQEPRSAQRPSARKALIFIAVLMILIGLLSSMGWGNVFNSSVPDKQPVPMHKPFQNSIEQTFQVNGQGTLTINGYFDSIYINSGPSNAVGVQSDTKAQVTQNGNDISIQGNYGPGNTLSITLPASMNLNIYNGDGNINISGTTSAVQAKTVDGNIFVENASGQMTLNTTSGNIGLNNVSLADNSSLTSNSGNIDFSGTLNAPGNYTMNTIYGDIDVSLPQNARFALDARGGDGVHNGFNTNDTGDNPHSSLTLRSDNGAISIHKQ